MLQSAPARSAVWGFCVEGDTVGVEIDHTAHAAVVTGGTWKVLLPAMQAGFTPHQIIATSTSLSGAINTIALHDILFGDVSALTLHPATTSGSVSFTID